MAEVVSDEKVGQPEPKKARPQRRVGPFHPHDETRLLRRFGIAYFLLAALVGAAVGFLIVAVGHDTTRAAKPAEGSPFRPTLYTGQSGPRQIAYAVSKKYRLASGKFLAPVPFAGSPILQGQAQDVRISAIVVRGSGITGENLQVVPTSASVMYILCGLGTDCAIREGKPTVARGVLLRREALEMTLDTFKFMPGVDSVLEFLPPPSGSKPDTALFFKRQDLAKEIALPLSATLPLRQRLVAGSLTQAEADKIVGLTAPRTYRFDSRSFTQLLDGSDALVLDPAS